MGSGSLPRGLARARRLIHVANGAFLEGVAQALDVPDGSYQVGVSSLVFNLFHTDRRAAAT
jgi:hypothetical protein